MARILASGISTHLGNDEIITIDLLEIDLGSSVLRFTDAPIAQSYDGETWNPGIISVGQLPFTVGAEDDRTEIVFDNTQRYWTNLASLGTVFEGAKVSIHRLFPSLGAPDAIDDYWFGSILRYTLEEDACKMDVGYGVNQLNRRAFRKYGSSCYNLFADGLHCPYAPLTGYGLPEVYFEGVATGGGATTLVDSSETFDAGANPVVAGHVAFIKSKKSKAAVLSVSGSTITVASWSGSNPGSGDKYIVGPAYTFCNYAKDGCVVRGMFGPNGTQDVTADLNTSTRRYMTAILTPARIDIQGKEKTYAGKTVRYSKLLEANDGLDGGSIPVLVGDVQLKSADVVGHFYADAPDTLYGHFLFIISEGRCMTIDPMGVTVNGEDPDDGPGPDATNDSFISWGIDQYAGGNDSSSVTSGELTLEQQKMAVGSRQSWHYVRSSGGDTYISNPRLFNDVTTGDGISLAGLTACRMRTEPGLGAPRALPELSAMVKGIMCRLPSGATEQTDDLNTTTWTSKPNAIQLAYEFLRNTRWGCGLADEQIDLTAVNTESDYCQESIQVTQSNKVTHTGLVAFGPNDAARTVPFSNWIAITDLSLSEARAYIGSILRIKGSDINHEILGAKQIRARGARDPFPGRGSVYVDEPYEEDRTIYLIVADDFVTVPSAGDTYEIIYGKASPHRFKANGILRMDVDCGEALQAILDNCDGTFIQADKKIKLVIPKKLTAAELLAIETGLLITDKGTNPTVIRRSGESTLKWIPLSLDEAPNEIVVEFSDKNSDWQNIQLSVKNTEAQKVLGTAYSENRRDRRAAVLSLALTNERDQGARIATRRLRRNGAVLGGWRNGTVEFDLPVHDAMALRPVEDVLPIASDHIPAYINFVRIMRIRENPDRITCKIEAIPYADWQYEDTSDEFGIAPIPDGIGDPTNDTPAPIKIYSLTDAGYFDDDGARHERVKIVLTLPDFS